MNDFDWSREVGDSLVFPTVRGVAVYFNPVGHIVIRQEAGPLDDEDVWIVVPRENLGALIAALTQLEQAE